MHCLKLKLSVFDLPTDAKEVLLRSIFVLRLSFLKFLEMMRKCLTGCKALKFMVGTALTDAGVEVGWGQAPP